MYDGPEMGISERFNSISWSGARLLGFQVMHDEGGIIDNVYLEVKMLFSDPAGGKRWKYSDIVLKDCRFIRCEIDLCAKADSGHAITHASCSSDSILKARLEKKSGALGGIYGREKRFADCLHFHFTLSPESGSIDVLSRDFGIRNDL